MQDSSREPAQAITDTDRLNWLIENETTVLKETGDSGFWCERFLEEWQQDGYHATAREAIDAAMRGER